jgi:uncharacterized glyoxalase superfamily protein PhnB
MKLRNLRPMLETENLKETLRFYTEQLGFKCYEVFPNAENLTWADLGRDEVALMFTARNAHSTIEKPMMTGSLYFTVNNVDEMWEELKDRVTVEYPVENFIYGMREFAIRDCNGYLLQFGQEIAPTATPSSTE